MSVGQPENKAAIREIFLKALEMQSPSEREAYLQGACGSEAALRARVDALLKSHENDSFLERPALEVGKPRSMPRSHYPKVPAQALAVTSCVKKSGKAASASFTWPSKTSR